MKRKTRSILEEINAMSPKRDKKHIVEQWAQVFDHNLINLIMKVLMWNGRLKQTFN